MILLIKISGKSHSDILKKYASSFIGRPFIKHASGDHPPYTQEGISETSPTFVEDILRHDLNYKIGDIIDVKYEPFSDNPNKSAYFAYIKLTNNQSPEYDSIKQGAASFYVSPQIFDLDPPLAGQPTTNFIPLHLAVVSNPAYGNIARIKGVCNGGGKPCINALKKAATELLNQVQKHVDYNNNIIDSSNEKNFNNRSYNTLVNNNNLDPNFPRENNNDSLQQLANVVDQTNTQAPAQQQQQFQAVYEKNQVQEVDSNGNIITRTVDKKPTKAPAQQQQSRQQTAIPPQSQNNNVISSIPQNVESTPQPVVSPSSLPNTTTPVSLETPQLPPEYVEKLKELDQLKQRLENIENFKKTAEEKQILEASEQQRQTIDAAFAEMFPDESQRAQVVDYFVKLNIPDSELPTLLEFIRTGTFKVGPPTADNNTPPTTKTSTTPAAVNKKNPIKGASVIYTAQRNNNNDSYLLTGVNYSSKFSNGFLGDVNLDKLLEE